jgi:alkylmercury lyase
MSRKSTVDRLVDAIAEAMPPVSARQLDLVLSAYGAMLAGTPVEVSALAAGADWRADEALSQLRDWPGVYFDNGGRVVGFWGLAVSPISRHLVTTKAGNAWAWCALDPLFILPLLGVRGTVSARSELGGQPVEFEVTPDQVILLAAGADEVYVSFLTPTGPFSSDIRLTFCDFVLFFDSRRSAGRWTDEHPRTIALPIDEAAEVGRRLAARLRNGASSKVA